MGGKGTARERAAAGLNPVPGIDMSLEEAEAFLATLKPEPAAEAPRRGKADRPSPAARPRFLRTASLPRCRRCRR